MKKIKGPGDGYTPRNVETGDKSYGKPGKGTDKNMNKALSEARAIGARFTKPTVTSGTKGKAKVFYAGDTQPIKKLPTAQPKPLPVDKPKISIPAKSTEKPAASKPKPKPTPSIANISSSAGKANNPKMKFASVSKGSEAGGKKHSTASIRKAKRK
jgi:hypothetical protein